MTKRQLLSPADGRGHADRMPLTRSAAAVAHSRAVPKLLTAPPLADRIAPLKARVAKLIENIPVLSPLGFHAVTRLKSCPLKKVTP